MDIKNALVLSGERAHKNNLAVQIYDKFLIRNTFIVFFKKVFFVIYSLHLHREK